MKPSRSPLLPFAAVTVLLLLNYPWLSLFSSSQLIAGIPPLFLYLFCLWLTFILTIRLLLKPSDDEETALPPDDAPNPQPRHPPNQQPGNRQAAEYDDA